MSENAKIQVILTGGTICSSINSSGKRYSDAKNVKIIDYFVSNNPDFANKVSFDVVTPLDILSENMTIEAWNILLAQLKKSIASKEYAGVIVLHGTDTLAYTSSLLSILLAGSDIPLFMVSSQLPLENSATNGHINFRTSVELIMNHIEPNVYAVYRNSDGVTYVHFGSHLTQCKNYSEDFYSEDAMIFSDENPAALVGKKYETSQLLLNHIKELEPCVLSINPYVGLNYNCFNLQGIKAIVQRTYHSETVCVGSSEHIRASSFSILNLLEKCKDMSIDVFIAPCSETAYQYETTGVALSNGGLPISAMTFEMAYVKTVIGCSLGKKGKELHSFIIDSVNHELVYAH